MGKSTTSFKPGQSGNPGGRPATPHIDPEKWEEIRADKQSIKDLIRCHLKLTPTQVQARITDPASPACERMVAQLIQNGMDNHNTARMLFEMAFGDMMDGPTLQDLTLDEQALIDEYRRRKAGSEITDESTG